MCYSGSGKLHMTVARNAVIASITYRRNLEWSKQTGLYTELATAIATATAFHSEGWISKT